MCDLIAQLHRFLEYLISDRGLSIVSTVLSVLAIFLGLFGIWRAELLFQKLDQNLEHLIEGMKRNMLQESSNVTASYAAFARALQAVELDPNELPRDGAFALLTTFNFLSLLNPGITPERFSELRKDTRRSVEESALDYVEMIVKSGMGNLRKRSPKIEPE
jgi:hypothetical protein